MMRSGLDLLQHPKKTYRSKGSIGENDADDKIKGSKRITKNEKEQRQNKIIKYFLRKWCFEERNMMLEAIR